MRTTKGEFKKFEGNDGATEKVTEGPTHPLGYEVRQVFTNDDCAPETCNPGQFLAKDILLLGATLMTLGEALQEK